MVVEPEAAVFPTEATIISDNAAAASAIKQSGRSDLADEHDRDGGEYLPNEPPPPFHQVLAFMVKRQESQSPSLNGCGGGGHHDEQSDGGRSSETPSSNRSNPPPPPNPLLPTPTIARTIVEATRGLDSNSSFGGGKFVEAITPVEGREPPFPIGEREKAVVEMFHHTRRQHTDNFGWSVPWSGPPHFPSFQQIPDPSTVASAVAALFGVAATKSGENIGSISAAGNMSMASLESSPMIAQPRQHSPSFSVNSVTNASSSSDYGGGGICAIKSSDTAHNGSSHFLCNQLLPGSRTEESSDGEDMDSTTTAQNGHQPLASSSPASSSASSPFRQTLTAPPISSQSTPTSTSKSRTTGSSYLLTLNQH